MPDSDYIGFNPEDQIATFQDRGVIRARKLLPDAKVRRAIDAMQTRMAEVGIWNNGHWDVEHLRDAPVNEGAKFARKLKSCLEFEELVDDEIPGVIAQLLDGESTFTGMETPQPLFTLPNADTWEVPHNVWHLDVPRLPCCHIPGVQVFTFLETVTPAGGGTLVVAGSHRLLNGSQRISSKDVKRQLKREPYFHDLMSKDTPNRERFTRQKGTCNGVQLQVVELHGEPGDVYFTDLRVLHAPAPNATGTPRIMLTRRYFLETIRDLIFPNS